MKKTRRKAPVYTVHENFITTSVYAKEVPKIDTKVFMDMGPPLRIINDFIINNLNRLTIRELPNELYSDWVNNPIIPDPIPGESLREHLISLVPKDLSFSKTLKWEAKIDEIVSCYEEYFHTVCSEAQDGHQGV